jgi:flagellar biosynthesis GTPase FlhF
MAETEVAAAPKGGKPSTILGLPRQKLILLLGALVAVIAIVGGLWHWSSVREEEREKAEAEKRQASDQAKKREAILAKIADQRATEQRALAERQALEARAAQERERSLKLLRSREIAEREAAAALPPEAAAEMASAVARQQEVEAARRQKAAEGQRLADAMRRWLPRYRDNLAPVINAGAAVRDGGADPRLCAGLRQAVAGVHFAASGDPQVDAGVAEALRFFTTAGSTCEKGAREATAQWLQRANDKLTAVERRLSVYQGQ